MKATVLKRVLAGSIAAVLLYGQTALPAGAENGGWEESAARSYSDAENSRMAAFISDEEGRQLTAEPGDLGLSESAIPLEAVPVSGQGALTEGEMDMSGEGSADTGPDYTSGSIDLSVSDGAAGENPEIHAGPEPEETDTVPAEDQGTAFGSGESLEGQTADEGFSDTGEETCEESFTEEYPEAVTDGRGENNDNNNKEENTEEAEETTDDSTEDEDREEKEKPASPYGDTEISAAAEGKDFSTRRLILAAEASVIVDPVNILSEYGGVYLMQYESEEQARLAFSYYSGKAYFVDADIPVQAAEEEDVTASPGGEDQDAAASPDEELPAAPDGMTETENPLTELEKEMQDVSPAAARTIALIDTGASGDVNDCVSVLGGETGDDNGHGSRMVQAIREQNPDANILSIKALDAGGNGNISSIYAAMQYAMAAGADIINLSVTAFSTAENAALADAVNEAVSRGILVVGAAGNGGTDARYYTPGNISAALIAGACDESGRRLSTSNYGDTVDCHVVAESTSQAAARLSGYLSLYGSIQDINENGLIFSTDYNGTETPEEEKTEDIWYRIDENGDFSVSDTITVRHFTIQYGDMPLGVHYLPSTGQLLYCIEPEKSSSSGSYSSFNALSAADKTKIAYISANGLQKMNARSANPAYVAARGDTVSDGSFVLYRRDFEITQMAIWHVVGREFGLSNNAENAQRNALIAAAEAYAGTNADGNYYIRELTMPAAGSTMTMHLSADRNYYETNEFTVTNRNGLGIEVSLGSGPDGAAVVQTGSSVNGSTLSRTYRIRIPASTVNNMTPGTKTWRIAVSGQGLVYSVAAYRQGGEQAVTLLTTATPVNQSLSATASLVVEERNGTVSLSKRSANTILTGGNSCYELAGAVYGIYKTEAAANAAAAAGAVGSAAAGTLTTTASGGSNSVSLEAGTYYVREIKASRGYSPDTVNHAVTVTAGQASTATSNETPLGNPAGLQVTKLNKATGDTTLPPKYTLEGAEYTVRFYAAAGASGTPAQTWVIKTVKTDRGAYTAGLDDAHKVSGSSAPYGKNASTGMYVLPLGTVTLQETKAPRGFRPDGAVYTGHIDGQSHITWDTVSGGSLKAVNTSGTELQHQEEPLVPEIGTTASDKTTGNHDGELSKTAVIVDQVSYRNLLDGETYTLDGTVVDKVTGETIASGSASVRADAASGTWTVEFPVDSSELRGRTVVVYEKLSIENTVIAKHEDPDDAAQAVTYEDPAITTDAADEKTGSRAGTVGHTEIIADTVHYEGVLPGREYTLRAVLMDQATGEPLQAEGTDITVEKKFTPEDRRGDILLEIPVDSTLLQGITAVCFERMYKNDLEVAVHADIHDDAQSVSYPIIETDARDDLTNDHVGRVSDLTRIIDTVHIRGLVPGLEYTVRGTLMNRETGEPFLKAAGENKEADGAGETDEASQTEMQAVTVEMTFAAEAFEFETELVFEIDPAIPDGCTAVAFESLYQSGIEIAVHSDLEDERQSVHYPAVTTDAKDGSSGTHIGTVGQAEVIVDTVTCRNLIAGQTYTVRGMLMDQKSGEPVTENGHPVTAEESFEAAAPEQQVEMTYTVNSSLLAGTSAVVFEDLLHNDVTLAVHHDLEDDAQSLLYPELPHKTVDRMSNSYGEEHVWTVTQTIPERFSRLDSTLQSFVMEDELDARLGWNRFISLKIRDCSGEDLIRETDYIVTEPETSSGGRLTVTVLSGSGTEKLKNNEGKVIELCFGTVIRDGTEATQTIVFEDRDYDDNANEELIPNRAGVTIGGVTNYTEKPYVYTGKIPLRKTNTAGRPLAGAVFSLFREDGSAFERNGRAYSLQSGKDGYALFQGLENGTYIIRETKAPKGAELPSGELTVVITDGVVTTVNGSPVSQKNRLITVTDRGKIVLHAGGSGTMGFLAAGTALLAAAALAAWRRRRRMSGGRFF